MISWFVSFVSSCAFLDKAAIWPFPFKFRNINETSLTAGPSTVPSDYATRSSPTAPIPSRYTVFQYSRNELRTLAAETGVPLPLSSQLVIAP